LDLWFLATEGGIMTSTLQTELRATLELKGLGQSGSLKFGSVEACEKSFETGRHFAREQDGKISMLT
jgi:hypothetical protein